METNKLANENAGRVDKDSSENLEIDIKQIFYALLDKLVLIVLAGVLAALLVFAYTKFMIAPVYQTQTQIYVYVESTTGSSTTTTSDISIATSLSSDYAEVITTTPVYEEVVENLGLGIEPSALGSMIGVSTIEDTRQIVITAKSTDPYLAQQVANEVREVASIRIEEVMKESGVTVSCVYEAELPTSPSSPNVTLNTLIGFLAGIFLACLIICIKVVFDDTIKTPDDIERYLNMSSLAMIPYQDEFDEEKGKRKKRKRKKKKKKSKSRSATADEQ